MRSQYPSHHLGNKELAVHAGDQETASRDVVGGEAGSNRGAAECLVPFGNSRQEVRAVKYCGTA
jgi:hypothetical protein